MNFITSFKAIDYNDAINNRPINIRGVGTGNNHSFTKYIDQPLAVCTNYKFKLQNLPMNLNDKCRMAIVSFDFVKNFGGFNCNQVGGVYVKSISPIDTFSSQGYYKGTLLLPAFFGQNVSYHNFDIEQNSIPLPHNINQLLQNGLDVFIDSKKTNLANQDVGGNIDQDTFSLALVIYELEDFEYVTNELTDGVQIYVPPKNYL